jgi:hypothetical protein
LSYTNPSTTSLKSYPISHHVSSRLAQAAGYTEE